MTYFIGTSGLLLPYKNKTFYPEALMNKSRLHVYSLLFNSIEINSSFYKIPRGTTLARWAGDVTEGFRFTFKLWKGITHTANMEYSPGDLQQFMEAVDAVGHKKGCILIQLPPSLTRAYHTQLEKLLRDVAHLSGGSWRICIEFRHSSWYSETTYKLLDGYHAGITFHDKLHSGMNLDETEAPFIYLRFHGPNGDYKGSYNDTLLEEYAGYINEWLLSGREVFAYFNNTMGNAIDNLQYMRKQILAQSH